MALNKNDTTVRAAIKTILFRIMDRQPSESQIDIFIDAYNSRPISESRQEKIASVYNLMNFSLNESRNIQARSSEIDRLVTEIEAQGGKGK